MDDRGDSSGAGALGMLSAYTAGGLVHLLLVIAIIQSQFPADRIGADRREGTLSAAIS